MNLIIQQFNKFLALGYVPNQNQEFKVSLDLPQLPGLITLERFLVLVLFIFLFLPLLIKQKDSAQENRRIKIIKLAALIGFIALLIRIYRTISGLN